MFMNLMVKNVHIVDEFDDGGQFIHPNQLRCTMNGLRR